MGDAWHPSGSTGATVSTGEQRCGTMRKSMQTNPLLVHTELGQVGGPFCARIGHDFGPRPGFDAGLILNIIRGHPTGMQHVLFAPLPWPR